jgi:hypothetical protein
MESGLVVMQALGGLYLCLFALPVSWIAVTIYRKRTR